MSHMDYVREALDFDRKDRLEREAWQEARAERTITPPGPVGYHRFVGVEGDEWCTTCLLPSTDPLHEIVVDHHD